MYSIKKYFFFISIFVIINMIQSSNLYSEETITTEPEWKKVCQDSGDSRICQTSFGQEIIYGEQRLWVSRVGVVQLNNEMKLFVYGPLGIRLADGVTYKIDDLPLEKMSYSACYNIQGCQATTDLDSTMLNKIKNGNTIIIDFTKPNGELLTATVSLIGFTKIFTSASSN